ncbi:MAG TPA: hypothetical protein VGS14_05950 [Actinomycetes bacterium]|jgi:hypothetical protein|nr:hypothetical protein [Actinomycetes bacterium]
MTVTEKELTLRAAQAENGKVAPSRVTTATAQSLDMTPAVEVPAAAEEWRKGYEKVLVAKVEKYLAAMDERRMQAQGNGQELGEVTVNNYVGLDVLSFSPIQAINLPPYEPSRIIAGGEDAVILALVFINPAVDVANGFAIPATVQLGGREIRIRFEQLNLTTVSNGPDFTVQGVLPSPAPSLLFVAFPFTAPNPGVNPALIEANVTVDIVDPAQPWAAFATHHVSLDADPAFLGIPPQPPQLLHNIPLRYMTYSQ